MLITFGVSSILSDKYSLDMLCNTQIVPFHLWIISEVLGRNQCNKKQVYRIKYSFGLLYGHLYIHGHNQELLFLVQICKNTSSIIEIMTKLDGSPGMVAKKSPVKHHAIYGIRYANDDSACCLLMSLWFFFLKCFLGKQVFSPICYHFYVL